jgi:hypothetical protein
MAQSEGGTSLWTWLLIGVGGYFLYEWFMGSSTTTTTTTSPGSTTAGQPTSVSPTGINTATTAPATATQPTVAPTPTANLSAPGAQPYLTNIANAVTANGGNPSSTYSGYQWNYFAQKAFGGAYIDPNVNGSSSYSLNSYMQLYLNNVIASGGNAAVSSALAGLRGLRGLGCVGCPNAGLGCTSCAYGMGAVVSDSDYTYSQMMKRTPGQPVADIYRNQAHRSEWEVSQN